MTYPETVPDGYRQNAKGDLVAIGNIKQIDLLRDELVQFVIDEGKHVAGIATDFKSAALKEIAAFVNQSASEHGVELGGKKGNVSLLSYDGRFKVIRANADNITFNEQLIAAKALIDECLHEWTKDSSDNLKTLVNKAFEVNKAGEISTGRVLGLRSLDITDERWNRAMQAISDSVTVVGSKTYLRIYERVADTDDYTQISLQG
jgi:hypothetical protein